MNTYNSEKERLLNNKIYDPMDNELLVLRTKAQKLCQEYNNLIIDDNQREKIINQLIPNKGNGVYFQGPIQFDYGEFTKIGNGVFFNFNFTCLDDGSVEIGNNVFFGPNVSLLTPVHPMRYQDRNMYKKEDGSTTDREYARAIKIKDNCWIAGNVTICGGVTIGQGTVIGAGSVVTRDIPDNVFAAGNPCRVIRDITENDSIENHPELLF